MKRKNTIDPDIERERMQVWGAYYDMSTGYALLETQILLAVLHGKYSRFSKDFFLKAFAYLISALDNHLIVQDPKFGIIFKKYYDGGKQLFFLMKMLQDEFPDQWEAMTQGDREKITKLFLEKFVSKIADWENAYLNQHHSAVFLRED